MSHRERLTVAFQSLSPWLFVVAFVVTLAQSLLGVAGAFLRAQIDPVLALVVGPIVALLVILLTLPLYVGLYAMVREESGPDSAVNAIRRNYRDVFLADAAAIAFALFAAVCGATLVLVLHTGVRFAQYAGGRVAPPLIRPIFYFLVAGALLGFWLGFLATRFADVLVAFDDRSPRSAWADSLRFVRRRPGAFAGYALVLTLLLGTPRVVGVALGQPASVDQLVVAIASAALVGTVALALVAAVHVAYFQGSVRPALAGERRGVPRRRFALAAMVVLAAVAGAVAVRTADVGVSGGEPQALPDDAAEAADVAIENTVSASHRQVGTVRNESADGSAEPFQVTAVDYEDRQLRIKLFGDGEEYIGGYFAEGILANHVTVTGEVSSDEWIVYPIPGYGLTGGDSLETSLDDGDWQVTNETSSTLTYRLEDPEEVDAIVSDGRLGTRGGLAEESQATLVVDRSAGVVDRVTYTLHSRETGHAYRYVERYENVTSHDLERPETLGPRGPLEWAWDALYY